MTNVQARRRLAAAATAAVSCGLLALLLVATLDAGGEARAQGLGSIDIQIPGLVGADVDLGGGSGQVVAVFSLESLPLERFVNPSGCTRLGPAAHVLVNLTSTPVTIHADPFCATPGLRVQPGFGSHVAPGAGSFAARPASTRSGRRTARPSRPAPRRRAAPR